MFPETTPSTVPAPSAMPTPPFRLLLATAVIKPNKSFISHTCVYSSHNHSNRLGHILFLGSEHNGSQGPSALIQPQRAREPRRCWGQKHFYSRRCSVFSLLPAICRSPTKSTSLCHLVENLYEEGAFHMTLVTMWSAACCPFSCLLFVLILTVFLLLMHANRRHFLRLRLRDYLTLFMFQS